MHRRRVIAGVAVCSCGAASGCSRLSGGGTDASAAIQAGVDALGEATAVLNTHRTRSVGEGPAFDASQVTRHTETARAAFDRASETASQDQQTLLTNLGHLADMLDGIAAVYEAADQILTDLNAIGGLVQSSRFDQATTQLDQTKTNLEAVRSNVQTVRVAASKVDDETYRAFEEIERATFETWSTEMGSWVDGMNYIVAGYEPFLDGMQTFETATTRWDEEEFDTAAKRFEAAKTKFDDALEEFETGATEGPSALRDDFEELTCKQETFRDGMARYAEAMRAAAAGDGGGYDQAIADAKDRLQRTC